MKMKQRIAPRSQIFRFEVAIKELFRIFNEKFDEKTIPKKQAMAISSEDCKELKYFQ